MKVEDLKADLKKGDMIYKGICHDCGIHVEVTARVAEEGAITIEGGAIYKVKQGLEDELFFKCDNCFKEDTTLRNYKRTEVFSRCVGYLRPVQQWNRGKLAEFAIRKEFTNTKGK